VRRTRAAEELKKELIKGRYNVKHTNRFRNFSADGNRGGCCHGCYLHQQWQAVFGPHLLVGLNMTAMVAVSASLSPFMQKGKLGALHIVV